MQMSRRTVRGFTHRTNDISALEDLTSQDCIENTRTTREASVAHDYSHGGRPL
jgi:hypothetical protein